MSVPAGVLGPRASRDDTRIIGSTVQRVITWETDQSPWKWVDRFLELAYGSVLCFYRNHDGERRCTAHIILVSDTTRVNCGRDRKPADSA